MGRKSRKKRKQSGGKSAADVAPLRTEQAAAVPSHSGTLAPLLAMLAVLLLTAWAYSPVLQAGFINFDDDDYVYENEMVLQGVTATGVGWAFSSAYAANYHPLTWLSHMVDVSLFGPSPKAMHAVNLLLHLACALLLFLLIKAATEKSWGALLVAGLFALHPLHVESVAWISERKDVLSTFFFLLTLLAWQAYGRKGGMLRYLLAAVFLALGLLAKPMLVTAPFVLLLLDYWPLHRKAELPTGKRFFALLLEKTPFLLLAGASVFLTLWAQGAAGAMATLDELPLAARFANAPVACLIYLWKTLWPTELGIFHPFQPVPTWQGIAATVLLAAVTLALVLKRRQAPWALMGWLWFLGTLAPVIGIIQVGGQAWADRYVYIPHMGLFWALAWGVLSVWKQLEGRLPSKKLQTGGIIAGCVLGLVLAMSAHTQAGVWKNSETLYLQTLSDGVPNYNVRYNLGVYYSKQGRRADAIKQYRLSLEAKPDNYKAMNNLAWLLAASPEEDLRDGMEAVRLAQQSLQITGPDPGVLDTLAVALAEAGRPYQALDLARKAAAAARKAGMNEIAGEIEKKIPFYEQGRAFHIAP